MNSLLDTLGNEKWMREHEAQLKAILPETWTHMANLDGPRIAFQLKPIGVDWRNADEFAKCMIFLERTGVMLRDGMLVRRGRPR